MTSNSDYRSRTRDHYKSAKVAAAYHRAFSVDRSWRAVRFRLQAWAERTIVRSFCTLVRHDRVIDIPAGTGKLAPVLVELGSHVTCCDVSESMLALARAEYANRGYKNVEFIICDAEQVPIVLQGKADLTICLRLLHRVPYEIKQSILGELAKIAPFAIVSMALDMKSNKLRRAVRGLVFQGTIRPEHGSILISSRDALRLMGVDFSIIAQRRVLGGLSEEVIFLLKSKVLSENEL